MVKYDWKTLDETGALHTGSKPEWTEHVDIVDIYKS